VLSQITSNIDGISFHYYTLRDAVLAGSGDMAIPAISASAARGKDGKVGCRTEADGLAMIRFYILKVTS